MAPSGFETFMQFVTARHEMLLCNQSVGVTESRFAELSSQCRNAILKHLVFLKFENDVQCSQCMTKILHGPMTQSDQHAVIDGINAKVVVALVTLRLGLEISILITWCRILGESRMSALSDS